MPMVPITAVSDHARERMRERSVSLASVADTWADPFEVRPDGHGGERLRGKTCTIVVRDGVLVTVI